MSLDDEAQADLQARPSGTQAHDQCSHLANAYRLLNHYGDRLLYVERIGWHTWGPPWRHDELGARRIAQELGRLIADEAAQLAVWAAKADNKEERERREKMVANRFRWASLSENAHTIEASLRMAQPLMACQADMLDADPMLLGLPSGVLDLRSGAHREHRQADRITKTAGCDFEPGAACPTWTRFLADTFAGDAEMLDYVQRLAGYALCGQRGEHLLPILYGSGANGKSTFLVTLQAMLGQYASTAAPGLLIKQHGTEHPTGLADLQGRRLVVVTETGEAGRLNEEQVKSLTGGDRITARRMRQDFYTFEPSHLLMMQTNHKPRVSGTDDGIWRRLRLVPFTVTVPPEKRDPRLPEKLRAELPGILQWAFEGWRKYQTHGFETPEAVKAATSDYRSASDQVGAFIEERCNLFPGATSRAGDLYRAYVDWCKEAGEHPRTQREFGMRLAERGFEKSRPGGVHTWRGITIADPNPQPWVRAA